MLFSELYSILHQIMADAFANLTKAQRIEKAVAACAADSKLSARRASIIYNVAHTTISRRLTQAVMTKKASDESQQLITPVEERTMVN
jgi:helix-turn-helix, Psq domain